MDTVLHLARSETCHEFTPSCRLAVPPQESLVTPPVVRKALVSGISHSTDGSVVFLRMSMANEGHNRYLRDFQSGQLPEMFTELAWGKQNWRSTKTHLNLKFLVELSLLYGSHERGLDMSLKEADPRRV
ncbi:hypothetical protein RUM43_012623 [Polyplax serrata]|uniref:Uncharacterized protein n=1 Tax=Polyplax serrata TaxID=468196 RepID=A0AAN8PSM9_POLSC